MQLLSEIERKIHRIGARQYLRNREPGNKGLVVDPALYVPRSRYMKACEPPPMERVPSLRKTTNSSNSGTRPGGSEASGGGKEGSDILLKRLRRFSRSDNRSFAVAARHRNELYPPASAVVLWRCPSRSSTG